MTNYAARVRAARKYANLTQQQLADALGVNVQTVKRRELDPADDLAQAPKKGERRAIADICGVPVSFMEEGFGGESRTEISQRLADLEEFTFDGSYSCAGGKSRRKATQMIRKLTVLNPGCRSMRPWEPGSTSTPAAFACRLLAVASPVRSLLPLSRSALRPMPLAVQLSIRATR